MRPRFARASVPLTVLATFVITFWSVTTDDNRVRGAAAGIAASAAVLYTALTRQLVREARRQSALSSAQVQDVRDSNQEQLALARRSLSAAEYARIDADASTAVVRSVQTGTWKRATGAGRDVASIALGDPAIATANFTLPMSVTLEVFGRLPLYLVFEQDPAPFELRTRGARPAARLVDPGKTVLNYDLTLTGEQLTACAAQGSWLPQSTDWALQNLELGFRSLNGDVTDHHHIEIVTELKLANDAIGRDVSTSWSYLHPAERHYRLD